MGYKLMVRIVGFSAVLALLATVIQLLVELRWEISVVQGTLKQVETSRLDGVANAIWDFDSSKVRIDLEQILRLPDVVRVELNTTLGEKYELGEEPPGGSKLDRAYNIVSKTHPDMPLGTLRVVASLEGIYAHLASKVFVILITQSLKTFVVSLFILMIANEMITRRLGSLARFARQLDADPESPAFRFAAPRPSKSDELDDVAAALNDMGAKVAERTRSLRASEEQFRAMVENLPLAIYLSVGLEQRCVYVNSAFTRLFGYQFEDVPTIEQWWPLAYPDQTYRTHVREEWTLRVKRAIETKSSIDPMEVTVTCKDGSKKDVLWGYICLGEKSYAYGLDLTDRKEAEEARQRLEDRLRRAEKMEALGALAGGVAHDLNNILAGIVGYSELLLEEAGEKSSLKPRLNKVMDAGLRASEVIQDMLAMARRGIQVKKTVNLNMIITDTQHSLEYERVLAAHPSICIKTELEPDLWNIAGSSVHLGKAFMNLLANACEAMPNAGTLTIKTSNEYLCRPLPGNEEVREGEYVVLTVSDQGEGIATADLKRIFEPFYTRKALGRSGTGLGLAVVWGTVKDHDGYIHVESEVGKGSTFSLYVPATREGLAADASLASNAEYRGRGESILIVDDLEVQRELATTMLAQMNYAVAAVASGEEAVEYVKENRVDLVILDMIMDPGMDGLDTYKRLLEITPGLKALIISGYSESERVREAQGLGAGTYVKKPYVMQKLISAVRKELDRPSREKTRRPVQ